MIKKIKYKWNKGDCFLMKGATIDEPMTLYFITSINDDYIQALTIYIHDTMVQGLDYPREYKNDIPAKAMLLPPGTYKRIKASMTDFVEEIKKFLGSHCIKESFKLRVGGHYWYRHIETITDIDGNKTKYNLFRLEDENISPCGTGEGTVDITEECGAEITDEIFEEIKHRYSQYVLNLKKSLFA